MQGRTRIFGLVWVVCVVLTCHRATAEQKRVQEQKGVERHALLIALNYGWTEHPKISYAHHSAHMFGEELKTYGYSSPYLLVGKEASREVIMKAVKGIVSKCDQDDELLVYFVGHGVRKMNHDGTRVHALIPADCAPHTPVQDLLLTRDLVRVLQSGAAQNTALILGTCHSGQIIDDLTEIPWWKVRKDDRRGQSLSVFTASGPMQLAFSNESETSSFFQDGMVEGLRAIASRSSGIVAAGELHEHTQKYLRSKTMGQQKPQYVQFGPHEFVFRRGIPSLRGQQE